MTQLHGFRDRKSRANKHPGIEAQPVVIVAGSKARLRRHPRVPAYDRHRFRDTGLLFCIAICKQRVTLARGDVVP